MKIKIKAKSAEENAEFSAQLAKASSDFAAGRDAVLNLPGGIVITFSHGGGGGPP